MVGAMVVIEEVMPLVAVGATTIETEVGKTAEATTMKVEAVNVTIEEGEDVENGEIRPQIVDIETSSEIRGTIIEEEEPLAETREVCFFLTPQRKRKRSIIK